MNTIDYNITIWCIRMYKQNITKNNKHLDTQVKKQIFTFANAFPFLTLLDKIFVFLHNIKDIDNGMNDLGHNVFYVNVL